MSYKKLGDIVKFISNKNVDGIATILYGINIDKFFMPSVANTIGVDLKKYKVVVKNQFACNRMHVGRDERLPISMSTFDYPFIVSPAYDVFEVTDENVIPEYLMLWFRRSEFDRQCWFYTDADVRGGLSLDALKSIEIGIPSIEKQREIVAQYQAVENKIKVNEQICEKLEATAQTLYKQWFVDFEFPITTESHPELVSGSHLHTYKSSGGKMVYNEELGKEVPEGWEVGNFESCLNFKTGKLDSNAAVENGVFPFFTCSEEIYKVNSYSFDQEAILLGGNNATGKFPLKYFRGKFDAYQRTYVIDSKSDRISNKQIYYRIKGLLKEMKEASVGTATKFLTMQIFNPIKIIIPNKSVSEVFEINTQKIYEMKESYFETNQKLTQLQSLLLSRLATLEG